MKLNQIASALMVLSLSPLALADFTIQDIRVEGLQRTEPSTVFNYLPVKVGDNFNDARSEEIIKNSTQPVSLTTCASKPWTIKSC